MANNFAAAALRMLKKFCKIEFQNNRLGRPIGPVGAMMIAWKHFLSTHDLFVKLIHGWVKIAFSVLAKTQKWKTQLADLFHWSMQAWRVVTRLLRVFLKTGKTIQFAI